MNNRYALLWAFGFLLIFIAIGVTITQAPSGTSEDRVRVNVCNNRPGPGYGEIITVYESEKHRYAPEDDQVCA